MIIGGPCTHLIVSNGLHFFGGDPLFFAMTVVGLYTLCDALVMYLFMKDKGGVGASLWAQSFVSQSIKLTAAYLVVKN